MPGVIARHIAAARNARRRVFKAEVTDRAMISSSYILAPNIFVLNIVRRGLAPSSTASGAIELELSFDRLGKRRGGQFGANRRRGNFGARRRWRT